ncbi:guanylate-binding protein 6-like [Zophobas morio]|uniref:guanylate-binding protein 6-like n=1 Tax=Zophobas morio TaxID=2755281 RepID=UPI0030836513
MGIWLCGGKIRTLKDGTNASVLFLDSEGFNSNQASQHYDSQIFAVSALLSSLLIYNTVKIIDQSAIDYLELLTTQAQMFSFNTQLHSEDGDFDMNMVKFPPLLWVVQDFFQETGSETPQEWLKRLLESQKEQNLRQLTKLFPAVDCHTLFLPAVEKDLLNDLSKSKDSDLTAEYKEGRNSLKKNIYKLLAAKKKRIYLSVKSDSSTDDYSYVNGPTFVTLLKLLIKGTNEGRLAEVPSVWKQFIKKQANITKDQCFDYYMKYIEFSNQRPPMVKSDIETKNNDVKKNALSLLKDLTLGLEDKQVARVAAQLEEMIDNAWKGIQTEYYRSVEDFCSAQYQTLLNQFVQNFDAKLPMETAALKPQLEVQRESLEQLFDEHLSQYSDVPGFNKILNEFKEKLDYESARLFELNKKKLQEVFSSAVNFSVEVYKHFMSESKSSNNARPHKIIKEQNSMAQQKAQLHFKNLVKGYEKEEGVYNSFKLLLNKLEGEWDHYEKINTELSLVELQHEMLKIIESLQIRFENELELPASMTYLETFLKNITIQARDDFLFFVVKGSYDIESIIKTVTEQMEIKMRSIIKEIREKNISLIKELIMNHCLTGTTGENIKSLKQSSYWWLPEFIPSSPKDKAVQLCLSALKRENHFSLSPSQMREIAVWVIDMQFQNKTIELLIFIFGTIFLVVVVKLYIDSVTAKRKLDSPAYRMKAFPQPTRRSFLQN